MESKPRRAAKRGSMEVYCEDHGLPNISFHFPSELPTSTPVTTRPPFRLTPWDSSGGCPWPFRIQLTALFTITRAPPSQIALLVLVTDCILFPLLSSTDNVLADVPFHSCINHGEVMVERRTSHFPAAFPTSFLSRCCPPSLSYPLKVTFFPER